MDASEDELDESAEAEQAAKRAAIAAARERLAAQEAEKERIQAEKAERRAKVAAAREEEVDRLAADAIGKISDEAGIRGRKNAIALLGKDLFAELRHGATCLAAQIEPDRSKAGGLAQVIARAAEERLLGSALARELRAIAPKD